MADNFIKLGFDNFIFNFQNYLNENPSFASELALLKTSLNEESIKNIDNFLDKILNKAILPTSLNPIKKEDFFSIEDEEVIKKETFLDEEKTSIYAKYKIPEDFLLEIPVFRHHCGLKFLEESALKRIKGASIIDGGAYFGDSSLVFNGYLPNKIYAFEPSSINYKFLQTTIKNNNLEGVITPVNLAIDSKKDEVPLFFNSINRPNLGASLTSSPSPKKKTENVETTSIDEFILENSINNLALIKLDIEGFELEAILAAKNTILKFKPVLLIAIYHNMAELLKIKPFLEDLNLGYKFIFAPLHRKTALQEFYLIAY